MVYVDQAIVEEDKLMRPVHTIGLPVRLVSSLHEGGIQYLGDLCRCTAGELLCIRNVGFKSMLVIIAALSTLGLSLSGEGESDEVAPSKMAHEDEGN
jgi:DNA-directed RNA polymerase alpha subunit